MLARPASFLLAVAFATCFIAVFTSAPWLAAIYGGSYLRHYSGHKNLGAAWCFYIFLTASMVLVVTARNAILFLFGWEIMTFASFFLVMFDDEQEQVLETKLGIGYHDGYVGFRLGYGEERSAPFLAAVTASNDGQGVDLRGKFGTFGRDAEEAKLLGEGGQ